jgi:hypothetical protein
MVGFGLVVMERALAVDKELWLLTKSMDGGCDKRELSWMLAALKERKQLLFFVYCHFLHLTMKMMGLWMELGGDDES